MSEWPPDSCPYCGSDDFHTFGYERRQPYTGIHCDDCGLHSKPMDRDTGVAACPRWKNRSVRDWYRENGHDDMADFINALEYSEKWDDLHLEDEHTSGLAWMKPDPDPLPQPRPSSRRSGTCFENESEEMRSACVSPLQRLLGADVVFHEVRHQSTGYHTDLVYADVDPGGVAALDEITVSREPLHEPLQRIKTWWYVYEREPITESEAIGNGLYSKPSKNEKHVNWLLNNGYLARSAGGVVVAVTPPKIAELHAVELKRRDWQTALEQAARASTTTADELQPPRRRDRYGYADYRWVALDAGAITAALQNEEAFRERGVGLIAVAGGGSVMKHIDAEYRPRRRYTRDRAFVESRVWDAIDIEEYVRSPGDDAVDEQAVMHPGNQVGLKFYEQDRGLVEVPTDE